MSAQTPYFPTLGGLCAVRLIQTSHFLRHLRCGSMCGGGGGGEERVGVIFAVKEFEVM